MKFPMTLLFLLYTAMQIHAGGKDVIDNEEILLQYLKQSVFSIDTSAQAVILYEKGSSFMDDGKLSFKVERTIKILSAEAADDLGKLNLPYDNDSYVRRISATTYNLEDGKVAKQSVERSDMLKDKIDKETTVTKFNLPSVRKGSIIHYSYTKEQPGFLFVPDWDFQNEYPTLCSEYEVNMPKYIVYNAIERVNVPLVEAKKNKELNDCEACYIDNSYGATNSRNWVRRNIPAFKREDFMSSSDNYLERVKVHVVAVRDKGLVIDIYNNWKDFSKKYFYKNDRGCGQAFARNNFLSEPTEALIAQKTTELDKARAIYNYVRNNFEVVASGGRSDEDIKDVFESKKGSAVGINLLLTAMLRKAGINSAPVYLSTRSNERLNMYYPNPRPINYLVSLATIDNKQRMFLDASERELPFGILKPQCYNGYCRIVSEQGDGAVLDPDSLLNKSVIIATLTPYENSKDKMLLKVQQQFGLLSGMAFRKEWRKDSALVRREFAGKLAKGSLKTTIKSFDIKNMALPDEKLTVEYEAVVDIATEAGTIYFDPYIVRFFDKNPYAATTRKYAVEREYKEDINYVFNMKLPDGYVIDDYPKSAVYKFSEQELITMKNVMQYDEQQHNFSLNSRFTTRTTLFAASEYNDLRSFYEQVMGEQQKKIVIKKTN